MVFFLKCVDCGITTKSSEIILDNLHYLSKLDLLDLSCIILVNH